MQSGNLKFLEPSWPLQACNGTDLPLHLLAWMLKAFGIHKHVQSTWLLVPCGRSGFNGKILLRIGWHSSLHFFFICHMMQTFSEWKLLRGSADKSLARPGRKHTTTTKLGIYSTYSSRNFTSPKKKSENCPSNQVSAAAMTSASDKKWRPFNCFLSPWNRW